MDNVTIYTDGACSGNPGVGGWGAILICKDAVKEISGGVADTTNNRMELQAVISAVECLKVPCSVFIYSDSAYVVNAFNQGWIANWQSTSWRTGGKKPVKNKDLWLRLIDAMKIHQIEFIKVKGHSDDLYNEKCDRLAKAAIEQIQ